MNKKTPVPFENARFHLVTRSVGIRLDAMLCTRSLDANVLLNADNRCVSHGEVTGAEALEVFRRTDLKAVTDRL